MTDVSFAPSRRLMSGRSIFVSRPLAVFPLALLLCLASCLYRAPAARATGQARALVLDPFPYQHSPGYSSQDVVSLLQTAGFAVTELDGTSVTVPAMKTLSHYAVIYLFTHSGPLPNKDAAVATGDTRHSRYRAYFNNQSLVKMHIISAENTFRYFDAITGRFIQKYDGHFSPHSIVFLNACTALGMTHFWKDLKASGVGTLISWRYHVDNTNADAGAHQLLTELASGHTVSEAVGLTQALGSGLSLVKGRVGVLSFEGDGQNNFKRVVSGAIGTQAK